MSLWRQMTFVVKIDVPRHEAESTMQMGAGSPWSVRIGLKHAGCVLDGVR